MCSRALCLAVTLRRCGIRGYPVTIEVEPLTGFECSCELKHAVRDGHRADAQVIGVEAKVRDLFCGAA